MIPKMRHIVALAVALALPALLPSAQAEDPAGPAGTLPPSVPVGFTVTPAAVAPAATSLSFSPDGQILYVATVGGAVLSYPVVGGVVTGPPLPFVEGLAQPLGVLATDEGVFISDKEAIAGRDWGFVLRARDLDGDGLAEDRQRVISLLPNGRHHTNGMALGPLDGQLYVTNGNSTDSGFGTEGGPEEIQPYSGSLLAVDPGATAPRPEPEMVVGTGWRNIYDVAFAPSGHPLNPDGDRQMAAVPMNGPDGQEYNGVQRPEGEDTLSVLDVATDQVEHFGFPWCLYDRDNGGLSGFTQDPAEGSCDPLPAKAYTGLPAGVGVQVKPQALFGMHVSANGLAFNPGTDFPSAYDHDLFVAEWGNIFGDELTGHKVVRVTFNADGSVADVVDFMTGVIPLDLTFAPDGSLWVADMAGVVYRVAAIGGT